MKPFRLVYVAFPSPADVLGGVAVNDTLSGGYVIAINTIKPAEEQTRTLKHELAHIVLGHVLDERTETDKSYLENLDAVEAEADCYADQMTDDEFLELMTYQIGETAYWEL